MFRTLRRNLSLSKKLLQQQQQQPPQKIEIFIDGKSVMVEPGSALIQACEQANITIPRFCYHSRLGIAGNCRMCLVEVEKVPKPVASCAYPISPGMKVFTDTPMVHKAREGVMEFLLANHPLDCPICDQGGECDLQDQSIRYGSDRGRFRELKGKRAVEDKDFGPLVKTEMTRCIHCTRCVRFSNEVAGAYELGTSGRGNDMQIGMYIDKILNTELSGNVIDLCPVGALTSKPYEFKSRPWELKKTESIDVMDAIGSHIRVDSRGLEVLRIQPRLNDDINEEWITDKTRFSYDGLKRQRLTQPLLKVNDRFVQVSWKDALEAARERLSGLKGSQISAVAGSFADGESLTVLKDFFSGLGSSNFYLEQQPLLSNVDFRSNYILNQGIRHAEDADVVLLVGTNPRYEASLYNTRLRKGWLQNGSEVGLIGSSVDLTYEYELVGKSAADLQSFEKHGFFKKLSAAKRPLIVIGSGVLEHASAPAVYAALSKLVKKVPQLVTDDWQGINFLQRSASQVGALDIGFYPNHLSTPLSDSNFVYLLQTDEFTRVPKDAFVIYQGSHGSASAQVADLLLPSFAYTEKSATFTNTEGRRQMTREAVHGPTGAREDWKIIKALAEVSQVPLDYEDVYEVRERLYELAGGSSYGLLEEPLPKEWLQLGLDSLADSKVKSKETFPAVVHDFYLTDFISKSSSTMAKCSQVFGKQQQTNEKQSVSAA